MNQNSNQSTWEAALKSLRKNRNFRDCSANYPLKNRSTMAYPGFLVSNEFDRFGIQLPKGKAELHLGVGSTTNWDIAAIREPKNLVVLDSSLDVLVAHHALYRPLFLISDTAESFLANLCAFNSTSRSSPPLSEIFNRISSEEAPDSAAIQRVQNQLNTLLFERLIDEAQLKFTLEVIRARPSEKSPYPFKWIAGHENLPQQFLHAYDSRKFSRLTWLPRLFHQSFSFLSKQSHYTVVRDLYRSGKIFLIKGAIPDAEVQCVVQKICEQERNFLTDVYVSNVPALLASSQGGQIEHNFTEWLRSFKSHSAQTLFVYEVKTLKYPHQFVTWVIEHKE